VARCWHLGDADLLSLDRGHEDVTEVGQRVVII
jgi:hypothetical protein